MPAPTMTTSASRLPAMAAKLAETTRVHSIAPAILARCYTAPVRRAPSEKRSDARAPGSDRRRVVGAPARAYRPTRPVPTRAAADTDARRRVRCPHYPDCVGCPLVGTPYGEQLRGKAAEARAALSVYPALAGLRLEKIVGSALAFGYRNHAKLVF